VLVLAWIFASSYASSGATAAWNTLLFAVLLFLCVLLHEFGQIFTARGPSACTDAIRDAVADWRYPAAWPYSGRAVGGIPSCAPGPAVNVVIATVLIVFAHAHPRANADIGVDDMQIPFVDRLAAVNLPACAAAASKAGQIARPISTAERSASLASGPYSTFCLTSNQIAAKMRLRVRRIRQRPRGGWHFSGDGVRFLQGGERPRVWRTKSFTSRL
jgi:hypothetical protein